MKTKCSFMPRGVGVLVASVLLLAACSGRDVPVGQNRPVVSAPVSMEIDAASDQSETPVLSVDDMKDRAPACLPEALPDYAALAKAPPVFKGFNIVTESVAEPESLKITIETINSEAGLRVEADAESGRITIDGQEITFLPPENRAGHTLIEGRVEWGDETATFLMPVQVGEAIKPMALGDYYHAGQDYVRLDDDTHRIEERLYTPATDWYINNYNMAKIGGYSHLLDYYDYRLPTGAGVSVLQAESFHTPVALSGGQTQEVRHLFAVEESDRHAEAVAEILTAVNNYPMLFTRYATYSRDLDVFHTTTTTALRAYLALGDYDYPRADADGAVLEPVDLLNVSNTNGGSTPKLVREMDRFIHENSLFACTALSSLPEGNKSTSGTGYNSVVVGPAPDPSAYYFAGAEVNDHCAPRQKPDLLAYAPFNASSFATPTVCSAAAMLLERARRETRLEEATAPEVLKAVLMASATRFNYKISTEWGDGLSQASRTVLFDEWQRTSDMQPLDFRYGAGVMNIFGAYRLLGEGSFDPVDSPFQLMPRQGWHYARESLNNTYHFLVEAPVVFSGLMTWQRYIDGELRSFLPDFRMILRQSDGQVVQVSDNKTANVELIEASLMPGLYSLEIELLASADVEGLSYGFAFIQKNRLPAPVQIDTEQDADVSPVIRWMTPEMTEGNVKYRVQLCDTRGCEAVKADEFLDVSFYTPDAGLIDEGDVLRIYTYPKDQDVSVYYPSAPTMLSLDALL